MKRKSERFCKDKVWDRLSQITIITFVIVGMIYAFNRGQFSGEACSYVIATISIQQHGSLVIKDSDIERMRAEGYPDYLADRVRDRVELQRYPQDIYGNSYPWYMGTYSISVIPIKMINSFLGVPQTYSHHVSNVVYYMFALWVVYFCFKQSRKNVFLTILLLACSPTFVYVTWASAEMFICSLLIISLVFFVNGNRYLAAFFISLASTLNLTIGGFGILMIVDYFISVYQHERCLNEDKLRISCIIQRHWKTTFGLAVCFFPALISPLWSLYRYRRISPMINASDISLLWPQRFFAYLVDLNFGFLPYFPILILLFFAISIIGIIKRERQIIILFLGFIITVFLYSGIFHINSGMTAMSRYNAWSAPFMIIAVTSQYENLFKKKYKGIVLKHIIAAIIAISAVVTLTSTKIVMRSTGGSYIHFTPIARFFLDNAPALYNPYPFTFINRNEHVDGGYHFGSTSPYIYFSDSGKARKILIPAMFIYSEEFIDSQLSASEDDIAWLKEQLLRIKSEYSGKWRYLNIPRYRNIYENS